MLITSTSYGTAFVSPRPFTPTDVAERERVTGRWHYLTNNRRTMVSATHLEAAYSANVRVVPPRHRSDGRVCWTVTHSPTGHVVAHGFAGFRDAPGSFAAAARRAIDRVSQYGCTTRVRPGDIGPWWGLDDPRKGIER